MADHKYAFQEFNPDKMVRAVGRFMSISTKQCIEICNHIRGRKLVRAKKILQDAAELKVPIPFKRFNNDMGHKRGIAAGRYAVNASGQIKKLLESCEKNASFKGLNTEGLTIVHINANQGPLQWHYGRQRRTRMKRTHVEVVLEEKAQAKKKTTKKTEKIQDKSQDKKQEETK